MNEKLNKFLSGIKNVFMSNRIKSKEINEKSENIGIDIAPGADITVIITRNDNKYLKPKYMIEVDRLFGIMTRVRKHRVKKKLAKRIKEIRKLEGQCWI